MGSVNLGEQYKNVMSVLEGTFRGRVVDAVVGQSTNGNEQIKYKLQIEGGPNHGRIFPDNATVTPAAMRMFFEKMAGFGLGENYFTVPEGEPPVTLDTVARDMVGRPCEFVLVKDEWRGTPREKVQRILPIKDAPPVVRSAAVGMTPGGVAPGGPLPGPVPAGGPGPVPTPAPAPEGGSVPPPDLPF
jgi:hypothetical protein